LDIENFNKISSKELIGKLRDFILATYGLECVEKRLFLVEPNETLNGKNLGDMKSDNIDAFELEKIQKQYPECFIKIYYKE